MIFMIHICSHLRFSGTAFAPRPTTPERQDSRRDRLGFPVLPPAGQYVNKKMQAILTTRPRLREQPGAVAKSPKTLDRLSRFVQSEFRVSLFCNQSGPIP